MPATAYSKPTGWDNFRKHTIVRAEGSWKLFLLASFFVEKSTQIVFFRGPRIVSSTGANPCIIETEEDHGFLVGDEIEIFGHESGVSRNGERSVLAVIDSTHFSISLDTTGSVGTEGIVGKPMPDSILSESTYVQVDPRTEASKNIPASDRPDGAILAAWEIDQVGTD